MFCPKCGGQNPDEGKFCRSCGTDLGNVSNALSTRAPITPPRLVNHKGKPISYESALTKIFSGIAFIAVSIALAFSIGKGWWFWMLIPALTSLGAGIAQYLQIRRAEKAPEFYAPAENSRLGSGPPRATLAPQSPAWVAPESRYKTGDLVPPSVTDSTTRRLEMDSEGKTMTLPKQ